MYVTCVATRNSEIPIHQQILPAVDSVYSISKGRKYRVVGMGVWCNVLHFLLPGDYGHPLFIPAALFEPTTAKLPSHWTFATNVSIAQPALEVTDAPSAILGYVALVEANGLARLLDGDEAAESAFRREVAGA